MQMEMVLMTSDSDVADAVEIAHNAGVDCVVLIVQGGCSWAEAGTGKSEIEAAAAAQKEIPCKCSSTHTR